VHDVISPSGPGGQVHNFRVVAGERRTHITGPPNHQTDLAPSTGAFERHDLHLRFPHQPRHRGVVVQTVVAVTVDITATAIDPIRPLTIIGEAAGVA
jgi:hypothetical protein